MSDQGRETPLWNSLEKSKLAVSALTPLLVLVVGIVLKCSISDIDRSVELRAKIYEEVGVNLNDIFAYNTFVGGWKNLSPEDVIDRKRAADKMMYTYKPFFTKELFDAYNAFIGESFKPFQEPGVDALIRSQVAGADGDRRIHGVLWKAAWADRFTGECNKDRQRRAYDDFLLKLKDDLSL